MRIQLVRWNEVTESCESNVHFQYHIRFFPFILFYRDDSCSREEQMGHVIIFLVFSFTSYVASYVVLAYRVVQASARAIVLLYKIV